MRTLAAVGIAAAALMLANAPPAAADVSSYLDDIYSSDYGFYGPTSDYMHLGNGVCSLVSTGMFNQDDLVAWVVRASGPGIYAPQAAYIVIAAEVYLC